MLILKFYIAIAFVLAPFLTWNFFLKASRLYSEVHKISLWMTVFGICLNSKILVAAWPLFCIFGLFELLRTEESSVFSVQKIFLVIPFIFSIVSSIWFFSGTFNLGLLSYDPTWSYYTAIHGAYLGWIFVGCLTFLAKRYTLTRFYKLACYLSFVFFLCVALGIDGIPYVKKIGVIGFALLIPSIILKFTFFEVHKNSKTRQFALISFISISLTLGLALINEFWPSAPRLLGDMPLMVITHGLVNALIALPCLAYSVYLEHSTSDSRDDPVNNVVFFDGFCVLCNTTVNILMSIDSKKKLKYSSLQGKLASNILAKIECEKPSSVVFYNGERAFKKSRAVLEILKNLGLFYQCLAWILFFIPKVLLDSIYDFIANTRYYFFGKTQTCRMPTVNEKNLFIP
jgi:predicted DCC family thiol-disulfide oxidoreductase YuxK